MKHPLDFCVSGLLLAIIVISLAACGVPTHISPFNSNPDLLATNQAVSTQLTVQVGVISTQQAAANTQPSIPPTATLPNVPLLSSATPVLPADAIQDTPKPLLLCTLTITDMVTVYDSPGGAENENIRLIERLAPGEHVIATSRANYGWYQVARLTSSPLGWVWEGDEKFSVAGSICSMLPSNTDVRPVPDPNRCWFLPWGDGFFGDIFDGLNPWASTLLGQVPGQMRYEVIMTSENRYQVRTESAIIGWMPANGVLHGSCGELPFVQTRPVPPVSVCAVFLNFPSEVHFRQEPDYNSGSLGSVPAGIWIIVVARTAANGYMDDWYQVRLGDGQQGWIEGGSTSSAHGATLEGPCQTLPVITGTMFKGSIDSSGIKTLRRP